MASALTPFRSKQEGEKIKVKCRYLEKGDDGDVFVKCKYYKLPWEKLVVEGHVIGAELGKVFGHLILAGKEGERGKVGNKTFTFQEIDLEVLGRKGRSVIVVIIGKGKYFGKVYGEIIEGFSEGEEVLGIVPLKKRDKAFLEVDGLYIEKELPIVTELKEIDIELPYEVIEVENGKVKIVNKVPLQTAYGELKPGTHTIDKNTMIMYKGIVETPTTFKVKTEMIFGGIKRAHKAMKGLYVMTHSGSYLVNEAVRELGYLSCYWDDELYAIGKNLYFNGKKIELPSRPYSCARAGDVAIVSIPSAPFSMRIELLYPTVTLSVSTKVPWDVPWGEGKAKLYFISDGVEVKEMEYGVYEIWSDNEFLYAFNIFGELRVYDGTEEIWKREANGILDITRYKDYLFVITKYPPRLWVYKDHKLIHKEPFEGYALCSSNAVYAFEKKEMKLYVPPDFKPLKAKAVEAWRCYAKNSIIVAGPQGLYNIIPLLRINKNP